MAQQTVTLEIEAVAEADMVRNDYGVRGSPVWYEPENIRFEEVSIGGETFTPKTLVDTFGEKGAEALLAMLDAAASENDDWDASYEPMGDAA